jgi:hypothetical protein
MGEAPMPLMLSILCLCLAAAVIAAPVNPAAEPVQSEPSELEIIRAQQLADFGELLDFTVGRDRAREGDPLRFLAGDMGEIVMDLAAYKTDKPVQDKQDQVVSRLDELIKMLEQACASSGGGRNPRPSSPAADSTIASGPGGGELHDVRSGDRDWGQLPPRAREQIQQSQTEGFPAGYESLLQSYYRRLAQEQPAEDTAPAAAQESPAP